MYGTHRKTSHANSTPMASPRHRGTVNFTLPPGTSKQMAKARANILPAHTTARGGTTDTQNRPVPSQTGWSRGLLSNVVSQPQDAMEISRAAIVPSVNTVRNIPSISSAASRLLAQYENQTRQEVIPGKDPHRRKSGHYNVTETTNIKL